MRKPARASAVGLGAVLLLGLGILMPSVAACQDQAWLGVYTQMLTPELRDGMSVDDEGVLVNRVVPNSPAARAGIRSGDVIVSLNSRSVATPDELSRAVRAARVGQTVSLAIVRDGARRTLSARLATQPEDPSDFDDDETEDLPAPRDADRTRERFFDLGDGNGLFRMGRGRLGVRIEDLNQDLGEAFNVPNGRGVLIVEVMDDTPAKRAGLRAGDVITRVDGSNVDDVADLTRTLREKDGRVSITVLRRGASRTVEAELVKDSRATWGNERSPMARNDRMFLRQAPEGTPAMRREIEELRRELQELRQKLEQLERRRD